MSGPTVSTRLLPLALLCLLAACGDSSPESSIRTVGLRTERMDFHAASQRGWNWCWAACVQMVLSVQDIEVPQELVVEETFAGWRPDAPGTPGDIARSLEGTFVDRHGRTWRATCRIGPGPPSFATLRERLELGVPVIVGYDVPGQEVSHAVVVTAVVFDDTPTGPVVERIVVRDPDPVRRATLGKRVLGRAEFDRVRTHYLVELTPIRSP